MNKKYDKFLFTYAVSKRAKEILDEGVHYLPEEEQGNKPIMEAIKEIESGIMNVLISETKIHEIKEEEDTLDTLYDNLKLPEQEIIVKPVIIPEMDRKRHKDILEDDEEEEEELASLDKETSLDEIDTEDIEPEDIDPLIALDDEDLEPADEDKEEKLPLAEI